MQTIMTFVSNYLLEHNEYIPLQQLHGVQQFQYLFDDPVDQLCLLLPDDEQFLLCQTYRHAENSWKVLNRQANIALELRLELLSFYHHRNVIFSGVLNLSCLVNKEWNYVLL